MNNDRVTAAAIARRAGVGRAAVSNWRRRYADFPEPVEEGPSPLFSWEAVEKWLVATGKASQLATAGRTDTGTQRLDDAEPDVTDLSPGELLARAMVALLPVPEGDGKPPIVLDPAFTDAGLLLAAADHFGDHVLLAGQGDRYVTPRVVQVLSARAHEGDALRGGPAYDVRPGDALTDNHQGRFAGRAAAVACLPPADRASPVHAADPRWRFGLPDAADIELAWVQHCLAQLRPHGVAVVGVSALTATRPSGQEIRAALVRAGALRAVIALPAELGVDQLWLLRRPARHDTRHREPVRFADLSSLADAADVPQDPGAWRHLLDGAPAVEPVELLDGDVDLSPARRVAQAPDAGDLAQIMTRLQVLYVKVARALPRPTPGHVARPGLVSLADLERVGAVTIRARDTAPVAGDVLVRSMGRPPIVADGTEDGRFAQVIAVDAEQVDAHFLALLLRAVLDASPVANTHGTPRRDDLRRCRVPRLPVVEQRRSGAAFRQLLELQDAVATLATLSAGVLDQTIHALTTGALLPKLSVGPGTIGVGASESEMQ